MTGPLTKLQRFVWRGTRNALCIVPASRRWLFPPAELAQQFGPGDASYAIKVYLHHARQLEAHGFEGAASVFETGPGRNLGSALLWWCRAMADNKENPRVVLWDVHPNADPTVPGFWPALAGELLLALEEIPVGEAVSTALSRTLQEIAKAALHPNITYLVCPLQELRLQLAGKRFELLLSHACLEHVWAIANYWRLAGELTAPGGWQSHRIDLADHGRRADNYLEMLEWTPLSYWLTMRFVPGAINRWRGHEHRSALELNGMQVLQCEAERRPSLPIPRASLSARYRHLPEEELRITAVDLVAQRHASKACDC